MQEFLFKSKPQSLPLAKHYYAEDNFWGLIYFLIAALEEVLLIAHYDMLISNLVVLAVTYGDNEYSMLEKQNSKLIYLLNSYTGSSEVYVLVKNTHPHTKKKKKYPYLIQNLGSKLSH